MLTKQSRAIALRTMEDGETIVVFIEEDTPDRISIMFSSNVLATYTLDEVDVTRLCHWLQQMLPRRFSS